ncbi:hypothetical protein BDC45DRAFT_506072 [Circinella umbellata]|nr:hypothetical protein BDC45DRAFT_506072 [Circinella umbellata]
MEPQHTIVELFPGFDELKKYIVENAKPNFDDFISINNEDIVLWSLTSSARSPSMLYSLWKERYMKAFKAYKSTRHIR